MWILKGTFLGLWVFAFGTLAFLCFTLFQNIRPHTAVGISAIAGYTAGNWLWWAALPVTTVAGCLVTRSWPGNRWFWASLVVTFLFPAGLLGLILALSSSHAMRDSN